MAPVKLVYLEGGERAGVPATMSDERIHYEIGEVVKISRPRFECCGVHSLFGPWVCIEPAGHREHCCYTHGRPASELCSVDGCGAPICDKPGCHPSHGQVRAIGVHRGAGAGAKHGHFWSRRQASAPRSLTNR